MAPFTSAVLIGALLMLALTPFDGGRELLDTGIFYIIGLPAGMAAAAVVAWHWPRGAWRYGFAVAFGQCLMSVVLNGDVGNLFPLTVMLFAALSLPMVMTAGFTGWLQRQYAV